MEPLERIPRQSPPPPPPSNNLFTKLLSVLTELKDSFVACFTPLTNRGRYINLPDSELDQKIQNYTHDSSATPKKSAVKSSDKRGGKQEFQENLTSMRTYPKDINQLLSAEKVHTRRKNEGRSLVSAIARLEKEAHSPLSPGEILETRIQRYSHIGLDDSVLESLFNRAAEGSYLIGKFADGYVLFIKKNNTLERHPFKQPEDEEGSPRNVIESNSQTYDGYDQFLESLGAIKGQIIRPKGRVETIAEEVFFHDLTLEQGIDFLRDKSDRSFIIVKSDKPEYSHVLLIKKESILPFVKPSYKAVYFNIIRSEGGKTLISTNKTQFKSFTSFLNAHETGKGKGIIDY